MRAALAAAAFELSAGVGNRASDVTAYTASGVAADRIFIELPEFQNEVQPLLDAHQAAGFSRYYDLAGQALSRRAVTSCRRTTCARWRSPPPG
jgi:hypothetical protein